MLIQGLGARARVMTRVGERPKSCLLTSKTCWVAPARDFTIGWATSNPTQRRIISILLALPMLVHASDDSSRRRSVLPSKVHQLFETFFSSCKRDMKAGSKAGAGDEEDGARDRT